MSKIIKYDLHAFVYVLCRQRKAPKSEKLEYVPAVHFVTKRLEHIEPLLKSMLESDEFEDAIFEAAQQLQVPIDNTAVPDKVYIVESADCDRPNNRNYAKFDPHFSYKGDQENYCIKLSLKLAKCLQKYADNCELTLFGCTVLVHEISHVLLYTALKLPATPSFFIEKNSVGDFGYFVERKMFKELKLGSGLNLFASRGGWLNKNCRYDNSDLGTADIFRLRLRPQYTRSVVKSMTWKAPANSDIVHEARFRDKKRVSRSVYDDENIYFRCCVPDYNKTLRPILQAKDEDDMKRLLGL